MAADTPIQQRRFTVDRKPVDVLHLITANKIADELQLRIGDLEVGETLALGDVAGTPTLQRTA